MDEQSVLIKRVAKYIPFVKSLIRRSKKVGNETNTQKLCVMLDIITQKKRLSQEKLKLTEKILRKLHLKDAQQKIKASSANNNIIDLEDSPDLKEIDLENSSVNCLLNFKAKLLQELQKITEDDSVIIDPIEKTKPDSFLQNEVIHLSSSDEEDTSNKTPAEIDLTEETDSDPETNSSTNERSNGTKQDANQEKALTVERDKVPTSHEFSTTENQQQNARTNERESLDSDKEKGKSPEGLRNNETIFIANPSNFNREETPLSIISDPKNMSLVTNVLGLISNTKKAQSKTEFRRLSEICPPRSISQSFLHAPPSVAHCSTANVDIAPKKPAFNPNVNNFNYTSNQQNLRFQNFNQRGMRYSYNYINRQNFQPNMPRYRNFYPNMNPRQYMHSNFQNNTNRLFRTPYYNETNYPRLEIQPNSFRAHWSNQIEPMNLDIRNQQNRTEPFSQIEHRDKPSKNNEMKTTQEVLKNSNNQEEINNKQDEKKEERILEKEALKTSSEKPAEGLEKESKSDSSHQEVIIKFLYHLIENEDKLKRNEMISKLLEIASEKLSHAELESITKVFNKSPPNISKQKKGKKETPKKLRKADNSSKAQSPNETSVKKKKKSSLERLYYDIKDMFIGNDVLDKLGPEIIKAMIPNQEPRIEASTSEKSDSALVQNVQSIEIESEKQPDTISNKSGDNINKESFKEPSNVNESFDQQPKSTGSRKRSSSIDRIDSPKKKKEDCNEDPNKETDLSDDMLNPLCAMIPNKEPRIEAPTSEKSDSFLAQNVQSIEVESEKQLETVSNKSDDYINKENFKQLSNLNEPFDQVPKNSDSRKRSSSIDRINFPKKKKKDCNEEPNKETGLRDDMLNELNAMIPNKEPRIEASTSEKADSVLAQNEQSMETESEKELETISNKNNNINKENLKELSNQNESFDQESKNPDSRKRSSSIDRTYSPKKKKDCNEDLNKKTDREDMLNQLYATDPNYHEVHGKKTLCKLCSQQFQFMGSHYRKKHPQYPVHSSRLSSEELTKAKEETQQYLEQFEKYLGGFSYKYPYKCRFCGFETITSCFVFYDHLSLHTGENRHSCKYCNFISNSTHYIKSHQVKIHPNEKVCVKSESVEKVIIFGYVCSLCNYTQMKRTNIEEHIKMFHKEDAYIYKINMSSLNVLNEGKNIKRQIRKKKPNRQRKKQTENEEEPNSSMKDDAFDTQFEGIIKTEEIDIKSDPEEDFEINIDSLINSIDVNDFKDEIKSEPSTENEAKEEENLEEEDLEERCKTPEMEELILNDNTVIERICRQEPNIQSNIEEAPPPPINISQQKQDALELIDGKYIKIYRKNKTLRFACFVYPCSFVSEDEEEFALHCRKYHWGFNVPGRTVICTLCSSSIIQRDNNQVLELFFKHLLSELRGVRTSVIKRIDDIIEKSHLVSSNNSFLSNH